MCIKVFIIHLITSRCRGCEYMHRSVNEVTWSIYIKDLLVVLAFTDDYSVMTEGILLINMVQFNLESRFVTDC